MYLQVISLLTAKAISFTVSHSVSEATDDIATINIFILVALDGIVMLWLFLLVFNLWLLGYPSDKQVVEKWLWFGVVVGLIIVFGWLCFVLNSNPVVWIIDYILDTKFNRIAILITWAVCIITFLFYVATFSRCLSKTATRKLFHAVVVVLFPPIAVIDPHFLSLSFSIAIMLLLFLEFCRVAGIRPIGPLIQPFYSQFVDERENDQKRKEPALILTPIYLLLGCALPHWVVYCGEAHYEAGIREQDQQLRNGESGKSLTFYCTQLVVGLCGVVVLGVGDSFAAIIGSNYGATKWPRCIASRSIEGSLAAFFSMTLSVELILIGCVVLRTTSIPSVTSIGDDVLMDPMLFEQCVLLARTLFVPLIITTLIEAYTTALDNLVLPIYALGLMAGALR